MVRSSNYTLYGDMSARVMRVLADFTPDLEVYSIDEAFLGLAGFERPAGGPCAGVAGDRAAMDRHPGVGRHRAHQDAGQGGQPHGQEGPRRAGVALLLTTSRPGGGTWRGWSSPICGASRAAWPSG